MDMAEDGVNIFSITDIDGRNANMQDAEFDYTSGQIELINNGHGFKLYDGEGNEFLTENLNGYRISRISNDERTIKLRKNQENDIEFELGSSDDDGEYDVNQFIARFPVNYRGGGTAMKKKSKTRRRKNKFKKRRKSKSKKRRKSKSKKRKKKTRRKRR